MLVKTPLTVATITQGQQKQIRFFNAANLVREKWQCKTKQFEHVANRY
jgi:hypothetical protein